MREKIFNYFFVGALTSAISVLMFAQEPVWKGKIAHEDGIEVIKNPAEPLYGKIRFELKEDLSVGNNEDENYLFYGNYDMTVDKLGNIYVVDGGHDRVQVFDREGKFVRSVGRKGQGPGEFHSPLGVFVSDQNGEIYVPDFRIAIRVFALDGNYLRSIPLKNYNRSYCISPGGIVIAETDKYLFKGNDRRQIRKILASLRFLDGSDGSETTIASYPDQLSKIIEGRIAKIYHGFEHVFQVCAIGPDTFVYGFSSDYVLNVIDSTGKLMLKIQKESPQFPISKKEKDAVRAKFDDPGNPIKDMNNFPLPDHKPHFGKILADGQWIFVEHFKSPQDQNKVWSLDVFNTQGFYLHTCTFPVRPKLIKSGFAYLIETSSETGDVRIKRYQIMNWDQLKKR